MTLVTLPYITELAAGQPEDIGKVLSDLQAIVAVVNGDIRDDNVNAAAAIAASKLAGVVKATDFDAAGDLMVGTGADTYAKLTKGTALQVLRVNAGETALEYATAASGGATVATTVAGLGTASSGKIGEIRAGGAGTIADSWKTVIYDEVYMKWMSAECEWPLGWIYLTSASYGTYLDSTAGSKAGNYCFESWKIFDTAGLTPQMKIAGVIDINVNGTPTARGGYGSANLGDNCGDLYTNGVALVAAVTADVGGVAVTALSGIAVASAWAQIPGGFTAKDLIFWGAQIKANANQGRFSGTVFSRWVG